MLLKPCISQGFLYLYKENAIRIARKNKFAKMPIKSHIFLFAFRRTKDIPLNADNNKEKTDANTYNFKIYKFFYIFKIYFHVKTSICFIIP